jgi:hypothetical protein
MPPISSFLLMVLEFYGIQLQHLSSHSFILVAIIVHFYEMSVGVRPSIPLFRLFHVLHWVGKGMNPIGTYYFQLRARGPVAYVVVVSLGKWDRWREDWVIVWVDPMIAWCFPLELQQAIEIIGRSFRGYRRASSPRSRGSDFLSVTACL